MRVNGNPKMMRRGQLSLLGELTIRQLRDEAHKERHLVDDDLPNVPDCPMSNPQSRRHGINV